MANTATISHKSTPKILTAYHAFEPEVLKRKELFPEVDRTTLLLYDEFIKCIKKGAFSSPLPTGEYNLWDFFSLFYIHSAHSVEYALNNWNPSYEGVASPLINFEPFSGIKSVGGGITNYQNGLVNNVYGQYSVDYVNSATTVFGFGGVDNINRGRRFYYGSTQGVRPHEQGNFTSTAFSAMPRHYIGYRDDITPSQIGTYLEAWINAVSIGSNTTTTTADRGTGGLGILGQFDSTVAVMESFNQVNRFGLTYTCNESSPNFMFNAESMHEICNNFLKKTGAI